jgi:UDP-N-acetylglucosamine 3-dehydrogenase
MIRLGVIGVGNMGLHHARVCSQLGGAELCAVADSDLARAAFVATRFGARAYADYREMLATESLDAVTIAVPTREHLPVALSVIEAKVHLLVEKPLAGSVADAEKLDRAAAVAGVKLAVGHVERFNPAVTELKALLDRGGLGKISSVVARRVGLMPPQVKDANVIVDLAVHDIDVLNYCFGRSPEVAAAVAGRALLSDRYDHAELFLRYGGAGCFVQVNWITPLKIRTLSVTGDAGHAELDYILQKLELYETVVAREYDTFGDFVVRFGQGRRTALPVAKCEPLHAELQDFVDSIRQDRPPRVTGLDGINALRVAEQALELAR